MATRAGIDPVDRYTLAHGAVGLGLGRAQVGFLPALALAVGWELLERKRPAPTRDSTVNAVGDVVALMAAWAVGKRM